MNLTLEFKGKVIKAMLEDRKNYGGTDSAFAKKYQLHSSIYSRIKNGEIDNIVSDSQWLTIGRILEVSNSERSWKFVKTDVVKMIEEEVLFCKSYSKARILVDEPEIGKTVSAKHLSRTLKNCFYLDCSQAKSKKLFICKLAQSIGVSGNGRLADIMENIKYSLRILEEPVVLLDEAGDVDYSVILLIKELWNATEGICGWYMIGADGLRQKFESGIHSKKVGYRELFSRYSSKYSSLIPIEKTEKINFYKKMITEVLTVNSTNKEIIPTIVRKCMVSQDGSIGGLRRAESLLILNS